MRFGLTCTGEDDFQKLQCILCNAAFSNFNLKPSMLKEHFNNKHGGSNVARHDTKSLKIKRVRFDFLGPFQDWVLFLLIRHCCWLYAKWHIKLRSPRSLIQLQNSFSNLVH